MLFFDPTYIIILPAILLAAFAQFNVKSTFQKFQQVYSKRGYTAAQVARDILDRNGLQSVRIERVNGNLTDHYDPRANVVRLSDSTYDSPSVAAIGVAAHEVGHAVQHATNYVPISIRNFILPITSIGSNLAMPLVIAGLIFSAQFLISIGIFLYAFMVLFQLVTLPVEFNASGRAMRTLEENGFLDSTELSQAKAVLKAAALTYVAALFSAILSLLRLLLLANRRNNRG